MQRETDVSQYATDYIELTGSGDIRIDFQGATTANLANTTAHSGEDMWWANRVDDSDARLTHAFDLSGVDSATLNFWTWYDIEDDWDYGYIMASTDGGTTWTPLTTADTTEENPNGNNFGPALTGCSGDPSSQEAGDECNATVDRADGRPDALRRQRRGAGALPVHHRRRGQLPRLLRGRHQHP